MSVKPTTAIEVATLLEDQFERFSRELNAFAYYVFTVLRLWHIAGDEERAVEWLRRAKPLLAHPRLEPLYYAWLYTSQDTPETAEPWVEAALETAPHHPEVLAGAVIVYHQLDAHRKKLEYARTLFAMLRTSQTAEWYLGALWTNRDMETNLTLNEAR